MSSTAQLLGVKPVLKLGKHFDARLQGLLGLRLVLGRKVERIVGIDILQAKTIVGHAEGLGQFARHLNEGFHLFVVHGF
jgi:ribulose 1,5-bisphosphate carboxylase large subunit-like protein